MPKKQPRKRASSVPYPQKLSEPLIEQVSEKLAAGNFRKVAAELCGIHPDTLSRWLLRGEQVIQHMEDCAEEGTEPDPIDDFDRLCAVMRRSAYRAECAAEEKALQALRKAAAGWEEVATEEIWDEDLNEGEGGWAPKARRVTGRFDPRAAKDFLERRHRDRWAPKVDIDLDGVVSKTVILQNVPEILTEEAAKEWAEKRAEMAEGHVDGQEAAPEEEAKPGTPE